MNIEWIETNPGGPWGPETKSLDQENWLSFKPGFPAGPIGPGTGISLPGAPEIEDLSNYSQMILWYQSYFYVKPKKTNSK